MLSSVEGQHFLPFRERFVLPIANQGLINVRGRNLVSAAANSNGVGKTSLASAICWGYFGVDLLGRKADAVACRFTKERCEVLLRSEDPIGEWAVKRTRRPASFEVEGIPGIASNEDPALIQAKLQMRLGYGLRTFKNAQVFGQGQFERFIHAEQDEQLRMLDEIQGLDFRSELDRAKTWRSQLQEKQKAIEAAIQTNDTAIAEAVRVIADLTQLKTQFVADKKLLLDAIVKRKTEREVQANELIRTRATLPDLRKKVEALDERRAGVDTAQQAWTVAVASQTTTAAAFESAQRALSNKQAEIEELLGEDKCPTCRQLVTKNRVTIRKAFEPDFVALRDTLTLTESAAARAQQRIDRSLNAYNERLQCYFSETETTDRREADRSVERLRNQCSAAIEQELTRQIKALEKLIDEDMHAEKLERSRKWEGAAPLIAAEKRKADAEVSIGANGARLVSLELYLNMAAYAVEAFGDHGIRSQLVDPVADYINERLAYHLETLAAGEVTVVMSAQTTYKKGTSRDRISFTPTWAWGGDGIGTGSGGQDQRVHLAVFAATQDLAENRGRRPFSLKIWDEPGDSLDARGQELFLQWVARQARERGTGLLITHSDQLSSAADVDRTWTVVLRKDGAHVEVS